MRKIYIVNSLIATVAFILMLGLEIDKNSPIRFLYIFYIGVSWALPGICMNTTFRSRALNPIVLSFVLLLSAVSCFNMVAGYLNYSVSARVYVSIGMSIVGGLLVLLYLFKAKRTNNSE